MRHPFFSQAQPGRSVRLLLFVAAILFVTGCQPPASQANANLAEDSQAVTTEDDEARDSNRAGSSSGAASAKTDPRGTENLDEPLVCLARTIYWEAKGERRAGMEAIASIVLNRVKNADFPNTVCGVVKQGGEQPPCQFSWWCDGKSDDVTEMDQYVIAKEIAVRALNGTLADATGGALYFHQAQISPAWANVFARTVAIDNHIFYRPKN